MARNSTRQAQDKLGVLKPDKELKKKKKNIVIVSETMWIW